MTHEARTALAAAEILAAARQFFAERVPHTAAFPEREGPGFLTLRGQGGEEIAIAVVDEGGARRVRASTLFFDQAVARFLHTLPAAGAVAA